MLSLKPSVRMPPGSDVGHEIERMDEIGQAATPPTRGVAAGLICQIFFGPVLALNSVRKSETETLR